MAEFDTKLDLGRIGSAELDLIVGATMNRVMSRPDRAVLWRQLGAPIAKRVDLSAPPVTAAEAGLSPATAYRAWAARPQVGRMWSVRKVVMLSALGLTGTGGPFGAALANVTAALFVTQGGSVTNLANPPSNYDCEQSNFTLPSTQFFSTHQLWVRGGEWLVVGISGTGVVTNLSIGGHAQVVEIDDSPEFLMTL